MVDHTLYSFESKPSTCEHILFVLLNQHHQQLQLPRLGGMIEPGRVIVKDHVYLVSNDSLGYSRDELYYVQERDPNDYLKAQFVSVRRKQYLLVCSRHRGNRKSCGHKAMLAKALGKSQFTLLYNIFMV